MNTKKDTLIINWKNKINQDELVLIKKILEKDGIIVFPTDTVYGLACNSYSKKAIQTLYEIKKRPYNKPICVLTDSINQIKKIAEITKKEERIIQEYMPGALTMILKHKNVFPSILTAGLDTVGVRIPDNEIALSILKECSLPLATTSANESGKIKNNIQDIIEYFKGKVDVIIEGKGNNSNIASTIIKLENEQIKVLREGSIKINNSFNK